MVFKQCTIFLFLHFFFQQVTICQQKDTLAYKWEQLLLQYKEGIISPEKYMDKADTLVIHHYGQPDLVHRLETYKQLAWEKDNQKWRRQQYYYFLIINARTNNETGKVIYYLQKRAEVFEEQGIHIDTGFSINTEKIGLYAQMADYKNAIKAYNRMLPSLQKLPEKYLTETANVWSTMVPLYALREGFVKLDDSVGLYGLLNIADKIYNSGRQNKNNSAWNLNISELLLKDIKSTVYIYKKQYDSAKVLLLEALAISNLPDESNANFGPSFKYDALASLTNFYIDLRNKDSALHYFNLLKEQKKEANVLFLQDNIKYQICESQVLELSGHHAQAYQALLKVYDITDSILKRNTVEIANNMYAQAMAEDSREQLEKQSRQKQRLTVTIVLILSASLLIIIILYGYYRKKQQKAIKTIEQLNQATALQVSELEERARIMQKMEQKKIGLELHDGLAGHLAHIKTLMETLILKNQEKETSERLSTVNQLVGEAYDVVRNKSHEWYGQSLRQEGSAFPERITAIVDVLLPSGKFEKEILIHDEQLYHFTLETKIEILYIVQEALVNVIKHAKADKLTLLLYEESNIIYLRIKDNGKSFETAQIKKKGLGLRSIQERAIKINGHFEIRTDKTGTEIIVSIPIPLLVQVS